MKRLFLLSVVCAMSAFGAARGPVVLETPVGVRCSTWMENGTTFLRVVNETDRSIAGTVTLNEIYEKAINVTNRLSAEIDGRWIEIDLPAKAEMIIRLGK